MACINIMKKNDAKKEFSIFLIESTDEMKIILTNSHQRKQRYYLAVMTSLRKKIKNRAPPVHQPSQTLFKKRLYFNVIYCHYDCIVKFISYGFCHPKFSILILSSAYHLPHFSMSILSSAFSMRHPPSAAIRSSAETRLFYAPAQQASQPRLANNVNNFLNRICSGQDKFVSSVTINPRVNHNNFWSVTN